MTHLQSIIYIIKAKDKKNNGRGMVVRVILCGSGMGLGVILPGVGQNGICFYSVGVRWDGSGKPLLFQSHHLCKGWAIN